MGERLEAVLDKRVESLCAFAAEAQAFLARSGVAPEAAFKVLLGLEETVRNLIEHARPSLTDQVEVSLEVLPGQVSLVLVDDGPAFDPSAGAPRFDPALPLEDRVPHGMGVFLLRQFMDGIHYQRLEARNRLELVVAR